MAFFYAMLLFFLRNGNADFVLTEFGETKKQTTYTYNDGVVTEG